MVVPLGEERACRFNRLCCAHNGVKQVHYDESMDGETRDLAYAQIMYCYRLARGNSWTCTHAAIVTFSKPILELNVEFCCEALMKIKSTCL